MQKDTINSLFDLICQKIGGRWILTGGSLVLAEFGGDRATEDIDLINMELEENLTRVRTQLFLEAKHLGLSPEQVNSAADFYLKQCPGWELHVLSLRKGPVGEVFRPDLTLFLALKLNRGTEVDVEDCKLAIAFCDAREFNQTLFDQWSNSRAKELLKKLPLKVN